MRFRKKPIVVEAWQFNGEDGKAWPQWLHDYISPEGHVCYFSSEAYMGIPKPGGTLLVANSDWIIKGLNGELYSCKSDLFAATYELEDEE